MMPGVPPGVQELADLGRFAIGFDPRDRARLHALWDEVSTPSVVGGAADAALRGGVGGAGTALGAVAFGELGGRRARRARLRRRRAATSCCARRTRSWPRRWRRCTPAREVEFVDCNRDDLCMSFADFEREGRARTGRARRSSCTSAGTSRSRSSAIAALCRARGHLPDRGLRARARRRAGTGAARARGATPACGRSTRPRRSRPARAACSSRATPTLLEFARAFRNYGKPDHAVPGLNFRLSEFTAALGLVQTERLDEIVAWKNDVAREHLDPLHPGRLQLPDGMVSGLYKYIVFDPIERSTGKVYDQPCHRILGHPVDLPEQRLGRREPLVRAAVLPAGADRCVRGAGERRRAQASAQPGGDRLEHARQRRDGRAPAARRAVVVGVVEQQHVAGRQAAADLARRRRRRRGAARVQSRPQRDHSSGVQPRARTARSAAERVDAVRRAVQPATPSRRRCVAAARSRSRAQRRGASRSRLRWRSPWTRDRVAGGRDLRRRSAAGRARTCSPTRKNVARAPCSREQLEHRRRALRVRAVVEGERDRAGERDPPRDAQRGAHRRRDRSQRGRAPGGPERRRAAPRRRGSHGRRTASGSRR